MAKNITTKMRAVGVYNFLPITDKLSLVDIEVDIPKPASKELLIQVKAFAMNPIDMKIRAIKDTIPKSPLILGWDGCGIVKSTGENVTMFKEGDAVYFASGVLNEGTNAQYTTVDEKLVGLKPKSFSFEQAAAMPITTLTAWEALFDRLRLTNSDKGKSILMINSAGGVGSIATQIANNLGLTVIGTASREETKQWSLSHGATHVINHRENLIEQLSELGYGKGVDYVLCMYDPYPYWEIIPKIIKPKGTVCSVVDISKPVMLNAFKEKSLTLAMEFLSTSSRFQTDDLIQHHQMLTEAADQFDKGVLKCTLTKTLSPFNAETLREAHALIESGKTIGKIVVTGFD